MNHPDARSSFVVTGRFVFWTLVLFFLVVAGVNATMMTMAIRTMPGLAVRNSYDASQLYNGEIALMRAQEERGWKAAARLRLVGEEALVSLDMRDKAGVLIGDLDVSVRLEHPEDRSKDRVVTLVRNSAGLYEGALQPVSRGARDLLIEASRSGERVYVSRNRVFLTE